MEIEGNAPNKADIPTLIKPNRTIYIDTKSQRFYFAIILASNSIGISSLAFPSSMAKAGLLLWILIMLIAMFISYTSSYMLVYCAKQINVKSYAEITSKMLGRWKCVIDLFYVFTNMGIILICYLTFNDFMSGILNHEYFDQKNKVVGSRESLFWIIAPNLLLLPLLTRKSIKDIKALSVISVFSVFLLSIFAIYVFLTKKNKLQMKQLEYFNHTQSPQAFTLLLFGFMNQQNILDVFSELKRKRVSTISDIVKMQSGILTFVYLTVALFIYLSFYNYPDITKLNIFAFDLEQNALYIFINFCVGLSIFLSSVVTFKPTKDVLMSYFHFETEYSENKANIIITVVLQVVLILSACILVILNINFLDMINVVSMFVAPLVCIYLPLYYSYKLLGKIKYLFLLAIVMGVNIAAIWEFL